MSRLRRPVHAGFVTLAVLLIGASGCGRHHTRAKLPVAPARIGTTETGVASWYGIPYHGRRAASGEVYDMNAATAAHRKLPFQTWVEVTNLSNGKSTDVRITDRGPFVRGRIIDLSQAAARDIDMLRSGTTRVRLRVIDPPKEATLATKTETTEPAATTTPITVPAIGEPASVQALDGYTVQAGAFADPVRAEALRQNLENSFMDARVIPHEKGLWRVLVGREMTLEQANELAIRVRKETGAALVVREPQSTTQDTPTPK
jgi:peptidoglycan lytic transglycosylase